MDWSVQVDGYCERVDFTFWAEPINALTNAAFIVAAILVSRRAVGIGRLLTLLLFLIGVGSFLFHTYATRWAGMADTLPILLFILVYLFAVHRDLIGLRWYWAVLATAGFFPFAAVVVPLLMRIPFFEVSAPYWTVPILLMIYGAVMGGETRRGFWIGAAILSVSLSFRSVDETVCAAVPFGTHFMWHILNAVMLGWMIVVHARLSLATRAARL